MNKFNYIEHYKKDAETFDYFQKKPSGTEHDERRVRESIINSIDKTCKKILDVGSGSAWVAKHFTKQNIDVTSLDISIKNISKAKTIFKNEYHKGIVADSYYLPFKDGSFDTVISSEVIEHVISPKDFIKELLRVLKPDGQLVITTPYKEVLYYHQCIHCNQLTPSHAHIHSFSEKDLINLCDDESIKINYHTFGNKILLHLRLHIFLQYLPYSLWKLIDKMFNLIYNYPVHIIVIYSKN